MKRLILSACIVAGCVGILLGQSYSVSTLSGPTKFDESSPLAPLYSPSAVAVDSQGNIFFADTTYHRIRRIDAGTGQITTVVGTGLSGSSGDGGPGNKAQVASPAGLVFDSAGNLYIADSGNHRIRKLDKSGMITLYAGSSGGFSGDGGPATNARLKNPQNLFVDSLGNLFIADKENNRIRRVDPKGIIRTVAGVGGNNTSTSGGLFGDTDPNAQVCTSTLPVVCTPAPQVGYAVLARLGQPRGVAVDSKGNVYIGDTANNRIRVVTVKIDSSSNPIDAQGIITTVAGLGPPALNGAPPGSTGNVVGLGVKDGVIGTLSQVNSPRGLAIDKSDNLYVAEQANGRIRVINTATGVISTFKSGLSGPESIALDSAGNVIVAESGANRISRISPDGTSTPLAGIPSSVLSTNARGVTTDASGNVVVTDTGNQVIRKIAAKDGSVSAFAGIGGVSGFSGDTNVTARQASELAPAGSTIPSQAVTSRLSGPWGGVYDASGNFYFADRGNHRVRKIDSTGNISTVAGSSFRIATINPDTLKAGSTATVNNGYFGDGLLATQAQLNNPSAVAVDNLGNLYIADTGNHVIRRVDPTGVISTFAGFAPPCAAAIPTQTSSGGTGTGPSCVGVSGAAGDGLPAIYAQLNSPQGVAVDATGKVYISDTSNHSIRVVTADGYINAAVGQISSSGNGGDKGQGLLATLDTPLGIATDVNGNLYIADQNNGRIKRWDPKTGIVTFIAGGGTDFGDAADALTTHLQVPLAVGTDSAGNVYFTDQTGRVRKLTPAAAK